MPEMKIEQECSNCKHLNRCDLTTERLLRMKFVCENYASTSDTELDAREELIDDFGRWALRYEVPSIKSMSAPKRYTRRRRRNV